MNRSPGAVVKKRWHKATERNKAAVVHGPIGVEFDILSSSPLLFAAPHDGTPA